MKMLPPASLCVENLRTYFYTHAMRTFIRSVDGVALKVEKGQTHGIVGESGSGKSVTALTIMGLIDSLPGVISGAIKLVYTPEHNIDLLKDLDRCVRLRFRENEILSVAKNAARWKKQNNVIMRAVRGKHIAMIFQDARKALNPFIPIGRQVREAVMLNTGLTDKKKARRRAVFWLDRVKLDNPDRRYYNTPGMLSGGMCQRAMIAMAMACEPSVLIADEPTTGLDAAIESRVVDLLNDLKQTLRLTTLLISHDMDVIKALADQVTVMYAGTVIEQGPAKHVLNLSAEPKHPYTSALLTAIPDRHRIINKTAPQPIRGDAPGVVYPPGGCRFYPRCDFAGPGMRALCRTQTPELRHIKDGVHVRCWLYSQTRQESQP